MAEVGRADLGILGGGQLARMLLMAAATLGLDVAVMEGAPDSPAGRLTRHEIVGTWDDHAALRRLASLAPTILLENEFVPARSLYLLEEAGATVVPGSAALAMVQDKLHQKTRLDAAGLPVPPFRPVEDTADVHSAARELGWPLLLKRRRNGYDGYGNRTLHGPDDVAAAFAALQGPPDGPAAERALMVEGYVSFKHELAIMVARSQGRPAWPGAAPSGTHARTPGAPDTPDTPDTPRDHIPPVEGLMGPEIRLYPVVETVQRNHICHHVYAPAAVPGGVAARAVELARAVVAALDLYGVAGIELFLTTDGTLLVNEVAPRVHNSGHYTIEACVTSQFENAVRAALGWPLGDTALVAPAAAMVNLLGSSKSAMVNLLGSSKSAMVNLLGSPKSGDEPVGPAAGGLTSRGLAAALSVEGAHMHLYGKRQSRPGRKMGHVTALGATLDDAIATAARAAERIIM